MQKLGTAILAAVICGVIVFVAVYAGGSSMGWDDDTTSIFAPGAGVFGAIFGFAIGLGAKPPRVCPFCKEAVQRGVYLHPWHNMFICAAHGEADIDEALQRTDGAFAAVKKQFG